MWEAGWLGRKALYLTYKCVWSDLPVQVETAERILVFGRIPLPECDLVNYFWPFRLGTNSYGKCSRNYNVAGVTSSEELRLCQDLCVSTPPTSMQ